MFMFIVCPYEDALMLLMKLARVTLARRCSPYQLGLVFLPDVVCPPCGLQILSDRLCEDMVQSCSF